jgi:ubiquinone/menaquinone biosynthesis C-methylase UbiE
MGKKSIFEKKWQDYDRWYERHTDVYQAELNSLRELIPSGRGLEIGVGTGRFAHPFQVEFGIDPALNMLHSAKKRGIKVVQGVGEKLPFQNDSFHFILIVVTLCFVNDVIMVFKESFRTLKSSGNLIIGMINKSSSLGKKYEKSRKKSEFYEHAEFISPEEILDPLKKTGFELIDSRQTLIQTSNKTIKDKSTKKGYNQGGFVVLKAQKI